ncbi:MAG: ABC transporter ATP-binding protein [Egibacteraceae bacterium]
MTKFDVDEVLRPVRQRPLRKLPRLAARSIALVWRAAPHEFAVSALLQCVAGVGVAAQLLVGRRVLEGVLSAGEAGEFGAVLPALAILAALTALVSFANVARVEQQRVLTELVGRHALDKVLDVAAHVDLRAYETPGFHDRLERAKINAIVRPVGVANGVLGVLGAGFAIAGIGAALFVLEPVFLAMVLVAYVPAWVATTRASKASHDFEVAQTERDRRRAYLLMTLTGKDEAKEVRAFGLAGFLRTRHDHLYAAKIADLRALVRRRLRLGLAGAFAAATLTAVTVATLVWFVASGRMPLAAAGAAAGAIVLLGQRLQRLSGAAGSLYEGSLFVVDFTSFVESLPALVAARPTGVPPARFESLAVRDVTFTYPSRDEPSLRGVSLDIRSGEVVALVGENGSGKTTLAKLLAGLYVPDTGAITWDGVDAAACDPDLLRRSVAVIFQDFVRYHLTVRENIGIGRHERYDDLEGIVAAARRSCAHPELAALQDGYDTRLGPHFLGGSDLSIGQWQRVALARAFFRDAPFLILDEPTAALDARAEAELFDSIRSLCQARSVLLISHRFSSVRCADRIYVLRRGAVVEHGTHDELMAASGLYAELFTLQASAYLEHLGQP